MDLLLRHNGNGCTTTPLRIVAIPVVVDLLLRHRVHHLRRKVEGVAIPVVVDLLLRPNLQYYMHSAVKVAIPVVVDLLLRLFESSNVDSIIRLGRNPCCSGPTPSTRREKQRLRLFRRVAIPVVVDLLLRQ